MPVMLVGVLALLLSTAAASTTEVDASKRAAGGESGSALAVDASSAFAIAPFLFIHPQNGLTLSWAYRPVGDAALQFDVDTKVRKVTATFRDTTGRAHVVIPKVEDGIYRARPPIGCAATSWSFFVQGMRRVEKMQALPCASAARVEFSFITDTQMDLVETTQLVEQMAKRDDAFTIHGGDIVDLGGVTSLWFEFLAAMQPLLKNRPLVAAAGNHDFFFDRAGENLDRFVGLAANKSFYRFRSGPVLVVVLNSTHITDSSFNQRQLLFLDAALKEPAPWKIVLFHHAMYTESFAHGIVSNLSGARFLQLRKQLEPIFQSRGVDLVVNGHVHLLERSFKDGVQYLVGGPAGGLMGVRTVENPFGQLSLEARSATAFTATSTTLEFVSFDKEGIELDRYSLKKKKQELLVTPAFGFDRPRVAK